MLYKRAIVSKDFWSGVIFLSMGVAALLLGADLRVGTAARMGPGFVPHAIGWILIVLGVAIGSKGFLPSSELAARVHFKPALLITVAITAFAWLLPNAGLVPALIALVVLSSSVVRTTFLATISIALGLIVLCVVVFKVLLEMPFPVLIGVW